MIAKIERHSNFKKSFKKRIKNNSKLRDQTDQRIKLFQENPSNPILKDHPLQGSKNSLRAFSISGDIRVLYLPISKNHVIFLDIGSHNQVY